MKYVISGIRYDNDGLRDICVQKLNSGKIPDWEKNLYTFILDWVEGQETFTLETTGSTGHPKNIIVSRSDLIASAERTISYFNLQPGNSILCALPLAYIAGKMVVVRALVGNLDLIPVKPSNDPLQRLNIPEFDFCSLVPYQVEHILINGSELGRIKKLLIGGAPLPGRIREKLKVLNSEIYETYGMTETLTHVALRQISPVSETTFHCLPGITVSSGEENCLVFHGKSLPVNPVITNDIGDTISPNEFEWVGRLDSVINSGSVKVSPERLERFIGKYLSCRTLIVTGEPHDTLGEMVILVIEGPELSNDEKQALSEAVKKLDQYIKPGKFYIIDKLPRSENGKILRKSIQFSDFTPSHFRP